MIERSENLTRLGEEIFDVLIVGGGINGATAAAALSARGVSTALIDKGDFASGTSSQTSNLAWGGIKYLESGEIGLVRSLCNSRNQLMDVYPSAVQEKRFLTSVPRGFRFPAFFVFLGALFYWALGNFRTEPARYLSKKTLKEREPAIDTTLVSAAFEYSDAHFRDNDARFVFNFIRDAMDRGAAIANYVENISVARDSDIWTSTCTDRASDERLTIRSRVIINAAGPWADRLNDIASQSTQHRHILSKGVHLIVDRVTLHDRILTFFATDGRPFFVIPMGPRTCIGTTDTPSDTAEVVVTDEDRQFLLDNVNEVLDLERPLNVDDIISERCGVRPLAVDDKSKTTDWIQLSRKHAIDVDSDRRFITIFGGKFTDCLNVGDEITDIVESLGVFVDRSVVRWYGEPEERSKRQFLDRAAELTAVSESGRECSEPLAERLWRRYGMQAHELLDAIEQEEAGTTIVSPGSELLQCELAFVARREMIVYLDDFMRRRTALGLIVPRKALIESGALERICWALFGEAGPREFARYLDSDKDVDDAAAVTA